MFAVPNVADSFFKFLMSSNVFCERSLYNFWNILFESVRGVFHLYAFMTLFCIHT